MVTIVVPSRIILPYRLRSISLIIILIYSRPYPLMCCMYFYYS